jgi:hypothetical protein
MPVRIVNARAYKEGLIVKEVLCSFPNIQKQRKPNGKKNCGDPLLMQVSPSFM